MISIDDSANIIPSNGSQVGNEIFHYDIPGTDLSLNVHYHPELVLDVVALGEAFQAALDYMAFNVALHQDYPLQPDPDKTPRIPGRGCSITVKSMNSPETRLVDHITFKDASNALACLSGIYQADYNASSTTVISKNFAAGKVKIIGIVIIGHFAD